MSLYVMSQDYWKTMGLINWQVECVFLHILVPIGAVCVQMGYHPKTEVKLFILFCFKFPFDIWYHLVVIRMIKAQIKSICSNNYIAIHQKDRRHRKFAYLTTKVFSQTGQVLFGFFCCCCCWLWFFVGFLFACFFGIFFLLWQIVNVTFFIEQWTYGES